MTKQLYISDWCKRMDYTPSNDYDPRYYDLSYYDTENECVVDEPELEITEYLEETFGIDCYRSGLYGVIYTENYEVQKCLQEAWSKEPVWFDCVSGEPSVSELLVDEGWQW